MAETRCLTADMLEVGMTHVETLMFTHEQVAQYCDLAGDRNAIHRDVEAARLRFPDVDDIIVPGGLIQISITGLFGTAIPGDGSLGLTFSPERMRKPVCPNEKLVIHIELTRKRREMAEFNILIEYADGVQVGRATSRVIGPDQRYHDWWASQQAG